MQHIFCRMSNLLNITVKGISNIFRNSTFRLLHRLPTVVPSVKQASSPQKLTFFNRSINVLLRAPARNRCTPAYDVNTNVTKDVILFKYENPKYYNVLNIFALCQFVFWTYLSHFAFTTLKDAPVEEIPGEELAWYLRINLGENKYRNGITIVCFLIGYGILCAAWLFTLRSVRYLILRKGGKDLAFVTYGPFNRNRILTVPLKFVSAQESREMARSQLPIKVKNRALYYVLDMRGEFRNPQLFDYTAGLKRRID
ncbi:transmembrane protein 223-like [Rhagoletis pomonella]|uniref:transmembrane protein 223-like n=1 Tax=Rhagoletis pomonella TaxID=28610 RepID=UPI00177E500B|nr:transmembrane protein 223-like [Rhagoletis pomonella]